MCIRDSLKEDPAVKASLDKALQYLLTTLPTLKRGDTRTVLGVWGHAYGPVSYTHLDVYKRQAA